MFMREKWLKRGGRLQMAWDSAFEIQDEDITGDLNGVSLPDICDDLLEVIKSKSKNLNHRISLRTSAHLIHGICVLYKKKLKSVCVDFGLLPSSYYSLDQLNEQNEESDRYSSQNEIEAVRHAESSENDEIVHKFNENHDVTKSFWPGLKRKFTLVPDNISLSNNNCNKCLENISEHSEREDILNDDLQSGNMHQNNSSSNEKSSKMSSRKRKSPSHHSGSLNTNKISKNASALRRVNETYDIEYESDEINWNIEDISASTRVNRGELIFNNNCTVDNNEMHSSLCHKDRILVYYSKEISKSNVEKSLILKNLSLNMDKCNNASKVNSLNELYEKDYITEIVILKILNFFWAKKKTVYLKSFLEMISSEYKTDFFISICQLNRYRYVEMNNEINHGKTGKIIAGPAFSALKLSNEWNPFKSVYFF